METCAGEIAAQRSQRAEHTQNRNECALRHVRRGAFARGVELGEFGSDVNDIQDAKHQ